MNSHDIILYYKYVHIDDLVAFTACQKKLCTKLGLKGRIIIAEEGINGTLEGTPTTIDAYIQDLKNDPRFADIHIKRSAGTGRAFPKLSVKARKEIVSGHLTDDVNPTEITGKKLAADDLAKWYEEGKKFTVVDMRNDYEFDVGHFAGSVFSGMNNFRDLGKVPERIADLKDETVLTVCTGGVRCEKASGYLVKNGFKDVYQLDGGIVTYMEKYPKGAFKGKLYVFDGRVTMGFDESPDREVIGKCSLCESPSELFVNCGNVACNVHFIACPDCMKNSKAYCSLSCEALCNIPTT